MYIVLVNRADWLGINFMDIFWGSLWFGSYILPLATLSFLVYLTLVTRLPLTVNGLALNSPINDGEPSLWLSTA